jgi:O-antigen/teichoic acid export membrane protein
VRPERRLGAAACYLAPSAVALALPLATLPVMTRWLGPDDYGMIAVAQVVASLFTGLASLGVNTGLERNYFKYEKDHAALARLFHTAHALVLGGIALLGALLALLGGPVSSLLFGRDDHAGFLFAMAIPAALGVLFTMQLTVFRNQGRARAFMTSSIAAGLLEAGSTIVLVTTTAAGVWSVPLGALVGKVIVVGAGWLTLRRVLRPGLDRRLAGEMLEIGLPLMPRAFVGVADNGVDRLALNWMVSLGQAGFFGLANRLGASVFSVMTSIEQLFIPQVYRLMFQGDEPATRIGRYLTPYFYISTLVAAAAILFVEEALWVLVAPAFWPLRFAAAVLAAYYGQLFFGKIIGAQWTFLKKTWYATPASVARLTLHLALTLALVGPMGALGAALALWIAATFVDGVCLAVAHRLYPIRYELRFVVPVMALLYAAAVWVVLPAFVPVPYLAHLAVRLALFAAFLAAGARWLLPLGGQVTTLLRGQGAAARA